MTWKVLDFQLEQKHCKG
uniref:Uncharacterized protein n=1 Tax=Rhizophora mucronata TaxID=61149 RepID=A0A2P2QB83_RHIMU